MQSTICWLTDQKAQVHTICINKTSNETVQIGTEHDLFTINWETNYS